MLPEVVEGAHQTLKIIAIAAQEYKEKYNIRVKIVFKKYRTILKVE